MFTGKFEYKTVIDQPIGEVWAFFSNNNNLATITGFPKVIVRGNDEVKKGSKVLLELNFIIMRLNWQGRIVDVNEKESFTDVGEKVPFPFRLWSHTHRFNSKGDKTMMVDEVTFRSWIPAPFIKVMLYGMFMDRKRQIRKMGRL
ncbi:SRPBCC family protein [Alteribacter aurantiacus]|uniref:SRPBCC family protein n=1 Tax=Alteribacter aurantiacus TaxID=254410 RepID=UPI000412F16F|nr:hypothetical protein [Alteribacter aurantiacus]